MRYPAVLELNYVPGSFTYLEEKNTPKRERCILKEKYNPEQDIFRVHSTMFDFTSSTEITWAVVAVLITFVVYYAWSLVRPKYVGQNIPPFPAPKRFLTGHLHLWVPKQELEVVRGMRAAAGDIFSLDFFGKLMVIVNGHENVKEICTKHWNEAPDRPVFVHQHVLDEVNCGVLNATGENWKAQRTATISIMRDLGMGKSRLAERIVEEVEVFVNKLKSFDAKPVDFKLLINISVSNVICAMIIGKRFDHSDPYFLKLVKQVDIAFTKVPTLAIGILVQFARYLPFDVTGIKMWVDSMFTFRHEFALPYIEASKQNSLENESTDCYIPAYRQKMEQETQKHATKFLNEKNLSASILHLFLGGTETTSTTITWCVLYCLHHPEVQEKAFKEINAHVGVNRFPTIADKPQLCYVEAIVRETQRMSAVSALLPRIASKDFEFKGYTIPKDTIILINTVSCLQDAKNWGDPEKFRPERFLTKEGTLHSPEEFVPFGMGKRTCLAENLAKMELFLFMAALIQNFRFEPENPEEMPTMKGQIQMVHAPVPYKVKFVPRSLE
ncbi:hypothetical protein EGW08_002436 [Elysia chlorotica]|uniref:Cytochrome P450 n=1 Tax=Elysia chlorotica TaxID=188477 RepID=A0A433U7Q2_ELYCH|nr:hypothetical protein EGW08_002436 [Elysia chlorotica]